jgi:hypothetical protein
MRTVHFIFLMGVALSSRLLAAQDISMLLAKTPIWTSIRTDDDRTGRLICEALRPLLQRAPEELRAELVKYVDGLRDENADKLGALSTIFVLNRMFFDVPQEDRQDSVQFFGGWNGVPSGNGKVNMMWPVGKDKAGNFTLVGHFAGYFGPEYRALEEFDFFWKKYGKRKVPR